MNTILNPPFTPEDIRKAVFDMHPDKAPRSNGMSVFLYQQFWDIIGLEVTEATLQILKDRESIADWNSTIATLISKVKNHITMKEFWPISLCNVCYKIVAKDMTNRLGPLLNNIVNKYQSVFMEERLISDNIIV